MGGRNSILNELKLFKRKVSKDVPVEKMILFNDQESLKVVDSAEFKKHKRYMIFLFQKTS